MANKIAAAWAASTPKAFYDILMLEGGQGKLPASVPLMGGCIAAFFGAQAGLHMLDHQPTAAAIFGASCAIVLGGLTAGMLALYKRRENTVQTITALAAIGAVISIMSIVLHFVFAVALPPPLPTHKLVSFLLFPMAVWNVFAFAWIYRHAALRTVPAFVLATLYVILAQFILGTLVR